MANPLNVSNQLQGLKSVIGLIKTNGNPQAVYAQLARQNPQTAREVESLLQAGKNPRDLAMSMLKQRGIDPQEIISLFNG